MPGNRTPGLVSVIMPFWNTHERFLLEAVESVLAQTYPSVELILIDDGSDSSSSENAQSIAGRTPARIRYVQHSPHANRGISAARNLGVSVAAGEFVAFLDADDVWDSTQIEEQVALLQQNPEAALLYGNTTYWLDWDTNSGAGEPNIEYKMGLRTAKLYQGPRILSLILQRRAISPCMTSVIARRQIFDDGITFEDEFHEHYEDQVFLAKVFAAYPVFVSDRCWGKYRQHRASVTAGGDDSDLARAWRLRYLQWLSDYLHETGLGDAGVRLALKSELWMLQNHTAERLITVLRNWRRKFRKAFGAVHAG